MNFAIFFRTHFFYGTPPVASSDSKSISKSESIFLSIIIIK